MKVLFNINYFTGGDGELSIKYAANKKEHILPLATHDGHNWSAELDLKAKKGAAFTYNYCVTKDGFVKRTEWGKTPRKVSLDGDMYIYDAWREAPLSPHLYTSAFTAGRTIKKTKLKTFKETLRLCATVPGIKPGQKLLLSTNQYHLDNWDAEKALEMVELSTNEWGVSLDASLLMLPFEYKLVIYDKETGTYTWQQGNNYGIYNLKLEEGGVYSMNDIRPPLAIVPVRAAGTVLPVFSLKTKKSFGIGDFGDLKKLIDWAYETDQKVVQLLPINDTTITNTWTDSYPYNSISVYALHPAYMDLAELPVTQTKKFKEEQKRLNAMAEVDYEEVCALKRAYTKAAFEKEGEKVFKAKGYQEFFDENKDWLMPYAAYSYLRDTNGTADYRAWPKYKVYKAKEIEKLCAPKSAAYKEISFYYYTQFKLHEQMLDAATHARKKGTILKGDIPIGVSPLSADAWQQPENFNMTKQAGAPPDAFSLNGQNWGFPTYNWAEMEKDGYKWWQSRLQKMAQYFDAYRIDHVLGFFRIWEIPMHSVHGLLGQFSPAIAMSAAEINGFGINFQKDFLNPFITQEVIAEKFGPLSEEVKKKYLNPLANGRYEMAHGFETQRKVEAAFAGKNDTKSNILKEGLYSLISNVLFVEDHNKKDMYHPRISALNDSYFKSLSEHEKWAYTNLYNHYFYHRHNDFWYGEAMKKLPALINATDMLVCAEDLGMIPACVSRVMSELKMLSLEIQRMPKNPAEKFAWCGNYPYLSVCTISTHDMATMRQWWEENKENTQRFYNDMLGRSGEAPQQADADICAQIIQQHLHSPSMLCVLSFQDWVAMDEDLRREDYNNERINVPANPKHYWRYRMHIALEDLLKSKKFNTRMREMLKQTSR